MYINAFSLKRFLAIFVCAILITSIGQALAASEYTITNTISGQGDVYIKHEGEEYTKFTNSTFLADSTLNLEIKASARDGYDITKVLLQKPQEEENVLLFEGRSNYNVVINSQLNTHKEDYTIDVEFSKEIPNIKIYGWNDSTELDFGAVDINKSGGLTKSIKIKNMGQATANITSMLFTGESTTLFKNNFDADHKCAQLNPGEYCHFNATFTPKTEGTFEGVLKINTKEKLTFEKQITGTGIIKPRISINGKAGNLDILFPDTKEGDLSQPQTLTIKNIGEIDIDIKDIEIDKKNSLDGEFQIQENLCTNTTLSHIAGSADSVCTIQVAFTPLDNSLYTKRTATLLFSDIENLLLPSTRFEGIGLSTDARLYLENSEEKIDYGKVYIGQDSSYNIYMSNKGLIPLDLNFDIKGDSEFEIDDKRTNCAAELKGYTEDVGSKCRLVIDFTPKKEETSGGVLEIQTNDSITPKISINLSGKGDKKDSDSKSSSSSSSEKDILGVSTSREELVCSDVTRKELNEFIFDDTKDIDLADYIHHLKRIGVIDGFEDGTFKPSHKVKREEMAKFIVNSMEIPIDTSGDPFPDVDKESTFGRFIQTLLNQEVIKGFEDGTFKPENYVTRAEATKFIVESLKLQGIDYTSGEYKHTFEDVLEDNKFEKYIAFLSDTKVGSEYVIKGFEDGSFKPDEHVTREQMSKIVFNSMKLLHRC